MSEMNLELPEGLKTVPNNKRLQPGRLLTVAIETSTLAALEQKLAEATEKGPKLLAEKRSLAYAAMTSDPEARARQREIEDELSGHKAELEMIEAAITEARQRVARAAARDQAKDRKARAQDAQKRLEAVKDLARQIDDHFTAGVTGVLKIESEVRHILSSLGLVSPSPMMIANGLDRASKTMAKPIIRDLPAMPPAHRRTFGSIVASWASGIGHSIDKILSGDLSASAISAINVDDDGNLLELEQAADPAAIETTAEKAARLNRDLNNEKGAAMHRDSGYWMQACRDASAGRSSHTRNEFYGELMRMAKALQAPNETLEAGRHKALQTTLGKALWSAMDKAPEFMPGMKEAERDSVQSAFWKSPRAQIRAAALRNTPISSSLKSTSARLCSAGQAKAVRWHFVG
jgi:hypothetical protein